MAIAGYPHKTMNEENIENLDSLKEEKVEENLDSNKGEQEEESTETVETLKVKNQSLYEQLKKAKGFERDEQGEWIKKPETKVVETKSKSKKSEELDYGQLAFYNTKSDAIKIESDEDLEFLKETIESTGKDQKSILTAKWFQTELKERQDAKVAANAIPGSSKRTGQSAQNTVEYWIAKKELPPTSDRELRQKVVNARIKSEKVGNVFTDTPVVGR